MLSFAVGYNFDNQNLMGSSKLVQAGHAGHGRHGGGAPALCGGPMMSALILWHFLIKKKGQEKMKSMTASTSIDPLLPHNPTLG